MNISVQIYNTDWFKRLQVTSRSGWDRLSTLWRTDEIRRQSLDLLRDWAEKNPRIVKIRLDSNFLLAFLRSRKFSVPMAQELIERYLVMLEYKHEEWKIFKNIEMGDEKVQELLQRGWIHISNFHLKYLKFDKFQFSVFYLNFQNLTNQIISALSLD